jgi:pimeloyl-ACP methyl ester carboxylesterase
MQGVKPFIGPRRGKTPRAEPSIPVAVRLLVALLGAKRAMPPRLRRRLELSGLSWSEIAPVLARIRGIEDWACEWGREAQNSLERGDDFRAAAQAFLGQLILSPFHPRKVELQSVFRESHLRYRHTLPGRTVTAMTLAGGRLSGLYERPENATRTPIILLPPLASVKEELTLLADPLLDAGHPVLRLELPGQGKSPAPLGPDTESLLRDALDEMGFETVYAGGISLGAFYAFRLAHAAGAGRVRGVFGVSPPALTTMRDWARQPAVIWQYLDLYFGTATRVETRQRALTLTLDDIAPALSCPVRLYHATRDTINPPDAAARYRALLPHLPLTDRLLTDRHACLLHLRDVIGPEIGTWIAEVESPEAQEANRGAANQDSRSGRTGPRQRPAPMKE